MDNWNDHREGDWDNPPGQKQDGPPEERYLGLTATQFNVAVLGVVAAVVLAVGLFFFGGAAAMQDLFTGDEKSSSESAAVVETVTPTATEVPSSPTPSPDATPTDASTPPTGDSDDGADDSGDSTDGTDESGDTVEQVLNTFDPFTMMGALGSSDSPSDITITGPTGASLTPSEQENESLKAILLQKDDLPSGFTSLGEMSYSIPIEDVTADMAISMFASGDLTSADFGPMVMSAALDGSGLASEFDDFDEMEGMTQADLDEAAAGMEEFGVTFADLEILDASGLGDAGMGMHMVMDFGGMFEAFGMPADDSIPDGIAYDMYIFLRGERVLMVMVMWPSDAAAGVDARALAEIMDARAAAQ